MAEAWRNTIYREEAEIVATAHHEDGQFVMRLHAPKTAATALPGQFVHLRVSGERPMRRPVSIMFTRPERGQIDLFVKIVGAGTRLLAERARGEKLSLLGPVGRPFDLADPSRRYVLLGGGVGIPPMLFAAQQLKGWGDAVLFAGTESPLPLALRPSQFLLPGVDGNAILGIEKLEEWQIPSRLASHADLFGCHEGFVTDLARRYLEALDAGERARCVLLACGPHPMLHAAARLGREMGIPAWLSLEEYMACAVGGCAGCVVRTREGGEDRYRRVCVDGPVFDAETLPEFA